MFCNSIIILGAIAPQMDDLVFVDWWDKVDNRFSGQGKRDSTQSLS
jgi:hypothetical protein